MRIVNLRPASVTSASPVASMRSDVGGEVLHHVRRVRRRADGDDGPHLRDLARRRQHRRAAERMPDQQRRRRRVARRWSAAATRSATFEEKLVLANSPSLAPRPVKSKRSTAMPRPASASAMREAAKMSFEQVKQCAKTA